MAVVQWRKAISLQPILLTAGLLLLIGLSAATVLLVQRSAEEFVRVTHTLRVQDRLSGLLLELRRTEASQRGYLYTGNGAYLEEYRTAVQGVAPKLDELKELTSDNYDRVRDLQIMDAMIGIKLAEINRSIELYGAGRIEQARALVRSGDGRAMMNALSDQVETTIADEGRLLDIRSKNARQTNNNLLLVTLFGAGLIVLFGGLSVFFAQRNIRQREAAQYELAATNDNLEQTIEYRTSEVRAARDRFEALAAERAVLLHEVNHRVGNSLQLIASMLHLQGSAGSSDEVKTALTQATNRVMAVAQVHRRLYTSGDVKSVAVDQYLKALVDDLRISSESGELEQLSISTETVETEPDRAIAIGIIVNELVTNALKYAYPSGAGPIRVALKATDPTHAMVSVEDEGIGYDGQSPSSTGGLGGRIVKAMAEKLGATIRHDNAGIGTRVEIAFAVDDTR